MTLLTHQQVEILASPEQIRQIAKGTKDQFPALDRIDYSQDERLKAVRLYRCKIQGWANDLNDLLGTIRRTLENITPGGSLPI